MRMNRREMFGVMGAGLAVGSGLLAEEPKKEFALKYMLSSCLYGTAKVEEILPEVGKAGGVAIDIWPKVHGDQREQLDAMGEEAFAALLKKHRVPLGCITQYPLGPFKLQGEMKLAQRLGCGTIVTGVGGPKGLSGAELKSAVGKFVEQMKPHVAIAEETGVVIAIENHAASLIETPDSLKWLAELRRSKHLGIALAPYHLPQDAGLLAGLIREISPTLRVFYAWQHGKGCMTKLPKEEELLQMPGRGGLDFRPLLGALRETGYAGWTSIFMHPVPRGIPILGTTAEVTGEINRARGYLEGALAR